MAVERDQTARWRGTVHLDVGQLGQCKCLCVCALASVSAWDSLNSLIAYFFVSCQLFDFLTAELDMFC